MTTFSEAPNSIYRNEEDGIEASVYFHVEGFAVTLKDTDANEVLPTVRIFPTVDEAGRYARKMVYSNCNFDKM